MRMLEAFERVRLAWSQFCEDILMELRLRLRQVLAIILTVWAIIAGLLTANALIGW